MNRLDHNTTVIAGLTASIIALVAVAAAAFAERPVGPVSSGLLAPWVLRPLARTGRANKRDVSATKEMWFTLVEQCRSPPDTSEGENHEPPARSKTSLSVSLFPSSPSSLSLPLPRRSAASTRCLQGRTPSPARRDRRLSRPPKTSPVTVVHSGASTWQVTLIGVVAAVAAAVVTAIVRAHSRTTKLRATAS